MLLENFLFYAFFLLWAVMFFVTGIVVGFIVGAKS
jgi:hypothetical protein